MSSYPPQRSTNWIAIISVVLTAAGMYAFGIRYVVRLNEADETKTQLIADLQREVADMRRDRETLTQAVTRIEVRVERIPVLEEKVEKLGESLKSGGKRR